MERRAASSLKCILPAGVCGGRAGRVWGWEFECLASRFTGVFLPSGGSVPSGEDTSLPRSLEAVWDSKG